MGMGLAELLNPDKINVNTSGSPTSARLYRPHTLSTANSWKRPLKLSTLESLDNKLSWNSHVDLVMKWANQITAFLCRNFSTCSRDVKSKCYKSLVCTQLDYASMTWDLYTKTNSAKVEAVQRRAARLCFNDYTAKPAVSLQWCKNLAGRICKQDGSRTRLSWCIRSSTTSLTSQQHSI